MATKDATSSSREQNPTQGRWWLVAAAMLLQFSIGGVYAWSVFGKALGSAEPFQLSKVQGALPFTVTIGMIFIGTYIGGRVQDQRGPRPVALTGGVIYAIGVILASFAQDRSELWLLVLGYGVISGFGLGLAYIVPIAMLQKWFPDKRGLIHGAGCRWLRLWRRPDLTHRPAPHREQQGRADEGFPAAGHRVPAVLADRRVVLP